MWPAPCEQYAFQSISSLLKKPAKGGMPDMDIEAARNVKYVHFIFLASPPILRMSCSPDKACITLPAPRKRRPLKKACVIRWNMPAVYAPTPQATNMYPSWLMVEYAITRFMSNCVSAMVAANMAVMPPVHVTTSSAVGRLVEYRVAPGHHEYAGRDHRRRVDERGDRGRAFHRVRQPDVQRELGGLAYRSGEEKERDYGDKAVAVAKYVDHLTGARAGRGEHDVVVQAAERDEYQDARRGRTRSRRRG